MLHKQFILMLTILMALTSVTFAQSTGVEAVIGDLPEEMKAGSSVDIVVTITNTGTSVWSISLLREACFTTFKLNCIDMPANDFILEPGQNISLNYRLTARYSTGKKKCKIDFYDDKKKIVTKEKTINILAD